jgi:Lon protease-like protein
MPLFPLGTVLVPGAPLPLQVFEPRYVQLLQDLLTSADPPEFGVVAIRHGHEVGAEAARDLHEVGCVARVRRAAALGDGRYAVVAVGAERFRLHRVATEAGTAYLTGEVTLLAEVAGVGDLDGLAAQLRSELDRYVEAVGAAAVAWPEDPAELSYAVGGALGLDLGERQSLLAAPDTAARLRHARTLVHREVGLARSLGVGTGPHPAAYNPN